jgi:hypothetical protein
VVREEKASLVSNYTQSLMRIAIWEKDRGKGQYIDNQVMHICSPNRNELKFLYFGFFRVALKLHKVKKQFEGEVDNSKRNESTDVPL